MSRCLSASRLLGVLFAGVSLAIVASSISGAWAAPEVIGFSLVHSGDGTEIGVWYPARGQPRQQDFGPYRQDAVPDAEPVGRGLALVVISHGNGGSFSGHLDTAAALAGAGFVVAALTHPGDNWRDQSRATRIEARPAALSALIDFMLRDWRFHDAIDPRRIGAFGFSSGGFTVLAAAGGRPDFTRIAQHCADHPAFYDCALLRAHPRVLSAGPIVRDGRIRALVVAAPALGFTFDHAGLSEVVQPVQLWRADDDHVLPAPFYADAVRVALPQPPDFHTVPGAGHFDFLAPCVPAQASLPICASAAGFDRVAFHRDFNGAVVTFFRRELD